jgi:hypothetical protein
VSDALDILVLRETFTQTLGVMEPWDAAMFLACLDQEPAEYALERNISEADVLACLDRARAVYSDLRDGAPPEKAREMYLQGLG